MIRRGRCGGWHYVTAATDRCGERVCGAVSPDPTADERNLAAQLAQSRADLDRRLVR